MASFKVRSLMLHVLPEEARRLPEGMGQCNCSSCTPSCTCASCSCGSCSCGSRTAHASDYSDESTRLSELAILKDQLKHVLVRSEEMAAVL